jgi:hypothetical protein
VRSFEYFVGDFVQFFEALVTVPNISPDGAGGICPTSEALWNVWRFLDRELKIEFFPRDLGNHYRQKPQQDEPGKKCVPVMLTIGRGSS